MDIKLETGLVQPLGEHNPESDCVKTKSFHLLKYPFEHFNPMQSEYLRALELSNWDANIVIAAPTASGKTVCCEIAMALAHAKNKKGVTLVPLKALAEEKHVDWGSIEHTFFDYNRQILTGDYSQSIKPEDLDAADIIIMTSEALDHRTRQINKNLWIKDIGFLIVDEAHMLGVDGERADRLETALMRFSKYNPDANIALLSATMTNANDLKEWLEKITGRECIYVESDYRPCKLNMNFRTYRELPYNQGGFKATEEKLMSEIFNLVREFRDDQWIIFTGGKRFGRECKRFFETMRFKETDFISADDSHKDRLAKVNNFKNGSIKYLFSTSLLAYGLNLPARRVVVANVKRGQQDIEVCDILQMVGRAGRPKYDKQGDAYVFMPESEDFYHKNRVVNGQEIKSRLRQPSTLGFHMVAEIANNQIWDIKSFNKWFDKSLAKSQGCEYDDKTITSMFEKLEKILMIKNNDGRYEATNLGRVCSWLYFSPEDVFDWWKNFQELFIMMGGKFSDAHIAWAITNINTWRNDVMYKDLKTDTLEYDNALGKPFYGGEEKWGACVWHMLRGIDNIKLINMEGTLRYDLHRIIQALKLIDIRYAKWGKTRFFDNIKARILYGVDDNLVDLVYIKNVGGVKANQLWEKGIKTKADFVNTENAYAVRTIMGKRYAESLEHAKQLIENKNKDGEDSFD